MPDLQHEFQADPLINQTLDGRLRVLRRIGEGGMGTVYVAEHIGLGKQVAVKVLNPQYASQADLVARLHGEARHAAAIHNEHIVAVFDIGATQGGRPYVVMELLQGESLAERLRRCRVLSEADTLRIGRQLASALAAAHKSGIVHRDIKPENIFLCPRDGGDFVKVLDFGISKAVSLSLSTPSGGITPPGGLSKISATDPRLTRTGAILGTPLYMSPEQVRGELLDHRVDIYALGVVLYECLTGSVPFLAPSYLAVIAKILTEKPETMSERSPERALPPDLEQIVMGAMAHDRDARYPSMDTLLEDIDRYSAGRELQRAAWKQSTGADSSLSFDEEFKEINPRRSSRSALPIAPILATAAVVLGAGMILTLWHVPQQPAPRPPQGAPVSSAPTAPVTSPATFETPAPSSVPAPSPGAPPVAPNDKLPGGGLGSAADDRHAYQVAAPSLRTPSPQTLPPPQPGDLQPARARSRQPSGAGAGAGGDSRSISPGAGRLRSGKGPNPPLPLPQPLLEEQAPNPFLSTPVAPRADLGT